MRKSFFWYTTLDAALWAVRRLCSADAGFQVEIWKDPPHVIQDLEAVFPYRVYAPWKVQLEHEDWPDTIDVSVVMEEVKDGLV